MVAKAQRQKTCGAIISYIGSWFIVSWLMIRSVTRTSKGHNNIFTFMRFGIVLVFTQETFCTSPFVPILSDEESFHTRSNKQRFLYFAIK